MAFQRAIIRHQRKGIAAAMDDRAMAIPMVSGSRLDEPQPQKRAQNKSLVRHPAQGLILDRHIIQEGHDAPWVVAWGLNTDPGMVTPGSALLG